MTGAISKQRPQDQSSGPLPFLPDVSATSHRLVSAALHKLAAVVELATPARERWIVQTESFYDALGRVYLELGDATPAEAERGMAMFKKLEGQGSAQQA